MAWSDMIPAWARAQGRPVTVSEIAEALGFTHGVALRRVITLVDRGELIDLGGRLKARPTKHQAPDAAPPVQARIWTVCHLLSLKSWYTARQVELLAEANHGYVTDYLRWLAQAGHLSVQRRPGRANLYRVHPEAPPETQAPIWINRRKKRTNARNKAG